MTAVRFELVVEVSEKYPMSEDEYVALYNEVCDRVVSTLRQAFSYVEVDDGEILYTDIPFNALSGDATYEAS